MVGREGSASPDPGYEAPAARLVEASARESRTIGVVVPDVAALRRAVAGEWPTPRTVRLPTQLVVRASTGPAADGATRPTSIAQELA